MVNLRHRAAVASAAVAAIVGATVLTSAGSAQAYEGRVYESGLGRFSVTEEEATWWWFAGNSVCDKLTEGLNSERQLQGRALGVSTDECWEWMDQCLRQEGVHAWLFIPADNTYYCTPPS